MKNRLASVLLLFTSAAFGQATVRDQFQKIETVQQAQAWVDANAALKPAILNLASGKDSTVIDKRLLKQGKGDIFSVGYVTYKVIDASEVVHFRASYIFLDGGSMDLPQIDSLKKILVQKISGGANWDQLSDQYTMDGNTTHGDTGWFFGELMMPKEFQEAVKAHKLGDVFFVDVADKQWHYIVKKTFDDEDKKNMTVLRANGR